MEVQFYDYLICVSSLQQKTSRNSTKETLFLINSYDLEVCHLGHAQFCIFYQLVWSSHLMK